MIAGNEHVYGRDHKKSEKSSDGHAALAANCDEFIFYDDLVREQEAKKKRAASRSTRKSSGGTAKKTANKTEDERRQEALDFMVETIEALIAERGGEEKLWGSMVKQTMKRRQPGFTESSYGYRSFKEMVDDAQKRKLLVAVRDEKVGQYSLRLTGSDE